MLHRAARNDIHNIKISPLVLSEVEGLLKGFSAFAQGFAVCDSFELSDRRLQRFAK
jgi:hypothetical protein